jgi:superfamily I DNA/RNA helicase
VLAITFTTAAAATLRQRLASVLGERAAAVDIATFHALGLRIVRQWSAELGFGLYPPAVYGRDDVRAVLRDVATGIGLELAPERGDREADPWSLSAARLANAVEHFRLRTAEAGSSWVDPDGLEEGSSTRWLKPTRHACENAGRSTTPACWSCPCSSCAPNRLPCACCRTPIGS